MSSSVSRSAAYSATVSGTTSNAKAPKKASKKPKKKKNQKKKGKSARKANQEKAWHEVLNVKTKEPERLVGDAKPADRAHLSTVKMNSEDIRGAREKHPGAAITSAYLWDLLSKGGIITWRDWRRYEMTIEVLRRKLVEPFPRLDDFDEVAKYRISLSANSKVSELDYTSFMQYAVGQYNSSTLYNRTGDDPNAAGGDRRLLGARQLANNVQSLASADTGPTQALATVDDTMQGMFRTIFDYYTPERAPPETRRVSPAVRVMYRYQFVQFFRQVGSDWARDMTEFGTDAWDFPQSNVAQSDPHLADLDDHSYVISKHLKRSVDSSGDAFRTAVASSFAYAVQTEDVALLQFCLRNGIAENVAMRERLPAMITGAKAKGMKPLLTLLQHSPITLLNPTATPDPANLETVDDPNNLGNQLAGMSDTMLRSFWKLARLGDAWAFEHQLNTLEKHFPKVDAVKILSHFMYRNVGAEQEPMITLTPSTCFWIAVYYGHYDLVQLLVNYGISHDGIQCYARGFEDVETVKLLITARKDKKMATIIDRGVDGNGGNPRAAMHHKITFLDTNLAAKHITEKAAFVVGLARGNPNARAALIEGGYTKDPAPKNMGDEWANFRLGDSELSALVEHHHSTAKQKEIKKELLNKTLLDLAMYYGRTDIVALLVEMGVKDSFQAGQTLKTVAAANLVTNQDIKAEKKKMPTKKAAAKKGSKKGSKKASAKKTSKKATASSAKKPGAFASSEERPAAAAPTTPSRVAGNTLKQASEEWSKNGSNDGETSSGEHSAVEQERESRRNRLECRLAQEMGESLRSSRMKSNGHLSYTMRRYMHMRDYQPPAPKLYTIYDDDSKKLRKHVEKMTKEGDKTDQRRQDERNEQSRKKQAAADAAAEAQRAREEENRRKEEASRKAEADRIQAANEKEAKAAQKKKEAEEKAAKKAADKAKKEADAKAKKDAKEAAALARKQAQAPPQQTPPTNTPPLMATPGGDATGTPAGTTPGATTTPTTGAFAASGSTPGGGVYATAEDSHDVEEGSNPGLSSNPGLDSDAATEPFHGGDEEELSEQQTSSSKSDKSDGSAKSSKSSKSDSGSGGSERSGSGSGKKSKSKSGSASGVKPTGSGSGGSGSGSGSGKKDGDDFERRREFSDLSSYDTGSEREADWFDFADCPVYVEQGRGPSEDPKDSKKTIPAKKLNYGRPDTDLNILANRLFYAVVSGRAVEFLGKEPSKTDAPPEPNAAPAPSDQPPPTANPVLVARDREMSGELSEEQERVLEGMYSEERSLEEQEEHHERVSAGTMTRNMVAGTYMTFPQFLVACALLLCKDVTRTTIVDDITKLERARDVAMRAVAKQKSASAAYSQSRAKSGSSSASSGSGSGSSD